MQTVASNPHKHCDWFKVFTDHFKYAPLFLSTTDDQLYKLLIGTCKVKIIKFELKVFFALYLVIVKLVLIQLLTVLLGQTRDDVTFLVQLVFPENSVLVWTQNSPSIWYKMLPHNNVL